jgi:DHA3 family tetracycline resistance protein-like MFS transporter
VYSVWLNHNIDSEARATVNSMRGQCDAFGQIGGGPLVGAIGTFGGLRLALLGSALLLTPALLVYRQVRNAAARS